jgi:hypothetical protein
MTEGSIWLDFDIALYVVQPTGEEMLLAQVWNWESKTWVTVAEYSNTDGNFDWRNEHIDISAQAMDKVFRIRFLAVGVNSLDIRSWFVDNIHVYRSCAGPTELTAEPAFGEGIILTWQLSGNNNFPSGIKSEDGSRDLAGFRVYQSVNGGYYVLLPGLPVGNQYIIPEDGLIPGSMYCYKISAVWESPTDECESALSNEACAIWTDIDNYPDPVKNGFSIYPNPADNQAFILSSNELKYVSVFNSTGQYIFEKAITGRQFELNTAGFTIGIYMVRVETTAGLTTRKLTIRR